jgi:molybdate transport repressor ModE-like protein
MLYIAYMALSASVRWHVHDIEIDPRVLDMLRAIARRGSLSQAIHDVGLSYRHAWGLLGRYENLLGQRLVKLERGRGATLTKLGERLAEASAECDRELAPQLERWAADFNRKVKRSATGASAVVVRASHDIALAQLRDMLARKRAVALQLSFEGSLDALRALARHQCDFAGFHIPDSPLRSLMLEPFRPLLADSALCLIHFVDREQGLMVAPGNPLGIRDIRDISRRKARFVNRQPGSGTRLFFDQLLTASGVRAAQIAGYHSEEFTHAAVAATVASGMADCAFGIEAAARQQHLDFVPVATERYYLATRKTALERPGPRALLAALSGRAVARMLAGLPGYRAAPGVDPIDARIALT